MRIDKYSIILILLLFNSSVSYSQERHTEFGINFRVNSIVIDSSYLDNYVRIQEIEEFLRAIRKGGTINIIEVSFCGAASPEGSYQINCKLAQGRLSSFESFIRKELDIPDSLITYKESYIQWDYLKSLVGNSGLIHKDEVIAILDEDASLVEYHNPNTLIDNRIVKLMELDGGKVWQQMNRLFFKEMRSACATFATYSKVLPPIQEPAVIPYIEAEAFEPVIETVKIVSDTTETGAPVIPVLAEWSREMHLKTNAAGLGMAIANIAAEVDLAKHWSFALPVYYSAWDYFKSTTKFRTFAVQPELRYWISEDNDGFFAGTHFGFAYFNFAFDGDYRYQDHNRNTPAIGGGMSIGYRLPISRNNRWRVELSLGVGAYSCHYDKFHNTPRTKNGLMLESIRKTFWGIDQAAVSFTYSFDLNKKGGGKR